MRMEHDTVLYCTNRQVRISRDPSDGIYLIRRRVMQATQFNASYNYAQFYARFFVIIIHNMRYPHYCEHVIRETAGEI